MITHVAVRFNGKVYSMPRPHRHHHVIALIVEKTGVATVDSLGEDQGFLDGAGRYLTRWQALRVAKKHGQLRDDRPIWNDELYSENLW